MRWTRPLLLVAILLILGGVGATFYSRLKEQSAASPSKPASLPFGMTSSAEGWTYTQYNVNKPVVYIKAKDMKELNNAFELTGVELHIFQKEGTQYDLVKSEKAAFNISKNILYSEGDVEITMGVPSDAPPKGRLMTIRSSGVTFESKTGKATTERATSFGFDQGEGTAVGAAYDPQIRELHMQSQIHLLWRGRDKKIKPMNVECGNLTYKEKDSKVYLGQWSKLIRDTLTLNAGPAVVSLDKGIIRQVDTEHALGTDQRPGRNIEYAADKLTMRFDENGEAQQIVGDQNARLVSHSDTTDTTVTGDRIDLAFDTASGDSVLTTAVSSGHSVAESKPVPAKGVQPSDTRILRSETITTHMRPNGQDIDSVETAAAGAIEFIPNRPGQPHRWMNGDRLWIKYGAKNQIDWLKSVNVNTRTLKPREKDAKQDPAPALTWSNELKADFDPKSNQLAQLEQTGNFRYEEGPRKAKADRALLEQARNLIHLTGGSRVWDSTGSTDSNQILLDQKNGDFTAEGAVNSTRLPDKKKDPNATGGMLSEDEPMHAKADKMVSTDNNLQIRYQGNAIAWQGTDRLEADVIEIDRDNDIVKAHGHVVSQLLDKAGDSKSGTNAKTDPAAPPAIVAVASKKQPEKPPDPNAAPVFTIVKAPDLIYHDDGKLATYTGGVELDRPNMKVKSEELRAFLRDTDDSNSSLDHAFAEGRVEIVQTAPDRTRTGTSEHAEYYVDEAKIILEKGRPQLVDTLKGSTKGRKLTWYSDDDRLLVDGAEGEPAQSKLRRKQHHP